MGKDRRLFNTKNTEGPSYAGGRILTPYDQDGHSVFVLKNSKGDDTYVQEVPRCKFRGVPICLACQNKQYVPKVNALTRHFAAMWKELIERGIIAQY